MLSIRKKIALTVAALVATTGVAASAQSSPSGSAQRKATVGISILPGIIGPGPGLATSSATNWAVIGKYSASQEGKKVLLQRLSGTTWVTAGKGEISHKGEAIFPVAPGVPGAPVTYRVDGPGAASAAVSTDRWGSDQDFSDDFTGTALSAAWGHRQQFYEPASKRECSKGDPKAVKVGRGTAQLSVLIDKTRKSLCKPKKPGKTKIFGKFKYRLNANIGTQATHTLTYGVMAARIKFQPLQGQHASLWMQPFKLSGATNAKEAGSEIDVIEWFGKDVPNGGLTSFVYAPTPTGPDKLDFGGNGGWIKKAEQYLTSEKDDWYKRYHVFSVEWTPTAYIFRIDGQETGRITSGISGVPEYPILSVLSSDYELSKLPGKDEKANLPQTMYVDWIRTWQDPAQIIPTATPTPIP
jgi:Glycosyl hydrolases family 16